MKAFVCRHPIQMTEADKQAARFALENGLRGIDEKNHASWKRFIRKLFSLEQGEIVEVGTKVPRCGVFHRLHMAIEQAVFNAQDRFTSFDMFRNWLKIGSGHVEWVPGAKGGIVPLPKSISYADLSEEDMREFHRNMLVFLRGPHAAPYLWKHLGEKAHDMMDAVLSEFDL